MIQRFVLSRCGDWAKIGCFDTETEEHWVTAEFIGGMSPGEFEQFKLALETELRQG